MMQRVSRWDPRSGPGRGAGGFAPVGPGRGGGYGGRGHPSGRGTMSSVNGGQSGMSNSSQSGMSNGGPSCMSNNTSSAHVFPGRG
eukprot:1063895-Rhodomonas_salina.1